MIKKIEDSTIIAKAEFLIEGLVDKPSHLSLSWLRKHGWAAVPVPDSFNDMDAEWISEAAQEAGYNVCLAVSTELEDDTRCYQIDMTQDDLVEFDLEFSLLNFVIVPEDRYFAIMKESGDYFIVAGPKEFVRKSIGCSFRTARRMFDLYADDNWPARTKAFWQGVAKRYEPFNSD